MPELRQEILQQRPFSSAAEEALLNLLRTADCLARAMQRIARPWGITSTQYNALRILRGAHPHGLTCSAIGERMITADPDVTRLLGRLRARKLVRQQRDKHDKRVLWNYIAQPGLDLLAEMDPVISKSPKDLLGHLTDADLTQFIRVLESARSHCENTQLEVSCEGKEETCASS